MGKILTFIMICIANLSFGQDQYSGFTGGISLGGISGVSRKPIDTYLESSTPYMIYKDIYGDVRSTSPSATFQVGYVFKSNLTAFAAYSGGFANDQPAFWHANVGYILYGGYDDQWGVMPYIGGGLWSMNADWKDRGAFFSQGIQIQNWRWYKDDRLSMYLQAEHTKKHFSVTVGFRGILMKKK